MVSNLGGGSPEGGEADQASVLARFAELLAGASRPAEGRFYGQLVQADRTNNSEIIRMIFEIVRFPGGEATTALTAALEFLCQFDVGDSATKHVIQALSARKDDFVTEFLISAVRELRMSADYRIDILAELSTREGESVDAFFAMFVQDSSMGSICCQYAHGCLLKRQGDELGSRREFAEYAQAVEEGVSDVMSGLAHL